MRQTVLITAVLIPLLVGLAFYIVRSPVATPTDIVLTATGCTTTHFTLPAHREPHITLFNRADTAMVFTLPRMASAVSLAPGQRMQLDLPRYIMGEFEFFCLTEQAHTELNGGIPHSGFICGIEAEALRPFALSAGMFVIEPHDRLQQLLESQAAGPASPHPKESYNMVFASLPFR